MVDKAGFLGTDMLGKVGQKGDHVMFGDGFDLINPGHVEGDILGLPDRGGAFLRDHPDGGEGVAGVSLDFKPDAEFGFGRPEGDHLGAGLAWDHRSLRAAL